MIVRVMVVLNRTVVDSDWTFRQQIKTDRNAPMSFKSLHIANNITA